VLAKLKTRLRACTLSAFRVTAGTSSVVITSSALNQPVAVGDLTIFNGSAIAEEAKNQQAPIRRLSLARNLAPSRGVELHLHKAAPVSNGIFYVVILRRPNHDCD
jgi:hypothetical protein